MSNERKTLAAAIQSREASDKISRFVDKGDFTEQSGIVWTAIVDYYSRDSSARSVDPEILVREIGRSLKSEKHRQAFEDLVGELSGLEVSPENVVHDFIEVKKENVANKLASELLSKGRNVPDLIEEYRKWQDAESLEESEDGRAVLQGVGLSEISKSYSEDALLRVWPSSLNKRLDGGMLRQQHLVVFARPEIGKTLFLINAISGFLSQGLKVLYAGNEDPIYDVALRVVCRLAKQSKFDVLADPEQADAAAREKGYDNLVLAELAPGSPSELDQLVEEYSADVLLIDQLRNIKVKEDNYVQQLEKAAKAARNIGKRHSALVVSVTQAGDSASNKSILEMGDVDSSNTGIPAQADVMVGIGATEEDLQMGRRTLCLPKNKRSGKHEFWPVRVDPVQNRVINLDVS